MAKSKKGKYWVFIYNNFNPRGAMNDFAFSFNTLDEYEREIEANEILGKYQVVDKDTGFTYEGDIGTVTKWVCKNIGGEVYE